MAAVMGIDDMDKRLDLTMNNPRNIFVSIRGYNNNGSDDVLVFSLAQARDLRNWLDEKIRSYEISRVNEI